MTEQERLKEKDDELFFLHPDSPMADELMVERERLMEIVNRAIAAGSMEREAKRSNGPS